MHVSQRVTETQSTNPAAIIANVVREHANEAAGLWTSRNRLATATRASLFELRRADERLTAHLDGLVVAADEGWRVCEAMLEDQSAGAVFVSAAVAVQAKQHERLERLFGLADNSPDACDGLISAFGWLERQHLQGTVAGLLTSAEPLGRLVGLAACGAHNVDPGLAAGRWFEDEQPLVRARALRTAGEVGCTGALGACKTALSDKDPDCQFWAAWSSVLLGDRGLALNALTRAGLVDGPHRARGFPLALQSTDTGGAHVVLQRLAADPAHLRSLVQGSGIAGEPSYVPWLIGLMAKNESARLAGEAFTLVTGADLDALQLTRPRPEDAEPGPSESPEDENVEMDPDEGLPWPDPERVRRWWSGNASRFQDGTRYFMGAPVAREHCLDVLRNGFQHQRILAAHYLCLLVPGTPLFNTTAPAWRQRTVLGRME
jgi:uncharacterized protein (TIGR02270 family)